MRNSFLPRIVHLFVLSAISLLIFLIACKKSEKDIQPILDPDDLFFKETNGTDPIIQRIISALQTQNKKEKFVQKLVEKEGIPVWNKAIIQTTANDTVVAIPMVLKDTRYVNSYMLYKLKKKGSIAFLVKGRQPHFFSELTNKSLNAAKIARQLMALNNKVFGDIRFKISDGSILKRTAGQQVISFMPQSNSIGSTIAAIESPTPTLMDTSSTAISNNYQVANRVIVFCYLEDEGDDDGNEGGGGDNGGGGGEPLPAIKVPVWVCDVWITEDPPLPPGTPETPQTPSGGGNIGGGGSSGTSLPPLINYTCPAYYSQQQCEEMILPVVMPNDPSISTNISFIVQSLSISLGLNSDQSAWLINHATLANQIYNYLSVNNGVENYSIAESHIESMISEPDYLSFVENHLNTGNSSSVWWKDDIWLSNPNNFNLDISNPNNQYDELTPAEKALILSYPRQAYQISKNVKKAQEMTKLTMGIDGLNDKSDAFRHSYFNALNTRDVSPDYILGLSSSEIVREFAVAHESQVPPQLSLEKTMDLFNNEVGINYCLSCLSSTSDNTIADGIKQKLNNGYLRYLSPIWSPKFAQTGELINPSGDPHFYGFNGSNNLTTASHGITQSTVLKPTNQ